MKNNQAIVNLSTKKINFKFQNELFEMDLTEGDLEDNWNSFMTSDEVVRDLNFYIIEDTTFKLYFYAYGLTKDPDADTYSTNLNDETKIKIIEVIGTLGEYLDIPFDNTTALRFEVADKDGNVFYKSKSLNKASDEAVYGNGTLTAIDIYGNRKTC